MGIAVRICILASLEVIGKAGLWACTCDDTEVNTISGTLPIIDIDGMPVAPLAFEDDYDYDLPVKARHCPSDSTYHSSHSRDVRTGRKVRSSGQRGNRKRQRDADKTNAIYREDRRRWAALDAAENEAELAAEKRAERPQGKRHDFEALLQKQRTYV